MSGALKGIRVFDMTRVLVGPSATQVLGDLGADIIKIEKPAEGDDTRKWGPPYLKDDAGADTSESSYYLSANRNKRSITLDFTKPEGLALAKKLLAGCDILFENFRTGTLEKYGLGYEQLKKEFPRLIYCSLTGFGQTGPYAKNAGYDFMVQGMGGIMSLTGPVGGEPYKMGVAIADIMTGMYAMTGILAALYHREKTGHGQLIDIALLDSQVAWLSYTGQYYLTSGEVTPKVGNAHASIVPYEAFRAADGYIILAVGNDRQYQDFRTLAGIPEDERFRTNDGRVRHRAILIPIVSAAIAKHPQKYWIENLESRGVPCGPVNRIDQVFADPQVKARGMTVPMEHPLTGKPVTLIASPLKLSETPVSYRHAPPVLGQDTDGVLKGELKMTDAEIAALRGKGVI